MGQLSQLMKPASMVVTMLLSGIAAAQPQPWKPLFDGKSLAGWQETAFTGRGKVTVANGAIQLSSGAPLTGVTITQAVPRSNYEIRFDASRMSGGDFFASLTFPAGDSFATWVLGGWGGDIVGISNIDGWDASDNETRSYFTFENGKWYSFRLQVTESRIQAWIDDRPIVNVEIGGRQVSLRVGEIKLSTPLGFASYGSTGAIRKVEYRLIPPRTP